MAQRTVSLPIVVFGEIDQFHSDLYQAMEPVLENTRTLATNTRHGDVEQIDPQSLRYHAKGHLQNDLGSVDYITQHDNPWVNVVAGGLALVMAPAIVIQYDTPIAVASLVGIIGATAVGMEARRRFMGEFPDMRQINVHVQASNHDALDQLLGTLGCMFKEYQNPPIKV